jgi:aldehyde dehydrogenase (NAD+)
VFSPAVVLNDANLEKTVTSIVHGKFANVGQLCMATDYVLCERDVKDKFVDMLSKMIVEKYGEKARESSAYTRIINERHFK